MQRYHASGQEWEAARRRGDKELASRLKVEEKDVRRRYYDQLPKVEMSVCPYDGTLVERRFDPYGFDGLWWVHSVPAHDEPSCSHLITIRGAVDLHGKKPPPRGDTQEANIGPDVPYVVPYLIRQPGVVAVIGELAMEPGYTAYPICYFGDPLPPPEKRIAHWGQTQFYYVKTNGEHGWRFDHQWGFNLRRWLRAGKLRWCVPGSGNRLLSNDPPDSCPYLKLRGVKQNQVVGARGVHTNGTPDGNSGGAHLDD
jgi:hypothetical protein